MASRDFNQDKIQPAAKSENSENKEDTKALVLYVDDSEMNLTLFKASFENDFNIILADSAQKGLELMQKEKVAVVISDQRMPGMSGTEMLEIIAKEYPDTLRFMLTAFTDYETVVDSVNRGQIYGFFNKPFNTDNVRQAVSKAIEVYELRTQKGKFTARLEQVNRELIEMDKSRTLFLDAITKELTVPLQKITSALHMLKNKAESGELAELINFLDTSVSKLENFTLTTNQLVTLRLKNDLLNLKEIPLREIIEIYLIDKKSRLSEGEIVVNLEEADPGIRIFAEESFILNALSIVTDRIVEMMEAKPNLVVEMTLGKEYSVLEMQFIAGFSEKKYLEWTAFFEKPDMLHYESNIEQILIIEIMQAHKGKIEITRENNTAIKVKLFFPK